MGGEKVTGLAAPTIEPGSPPHGRGKGDLDFDALASIGITPAWAGKRQLQNILFSMMRDHPRMGGEKT